MRRRKGEAGRAAGEGGTPSRIASSTTIGKSSAATEAFHADQRGVGSDRAANSSIVSTIRGRACFPRRRESGAGRPGVVSPVASRQRLTGETASRWKITVGGSPSARRSNWPRRAPRVGPQLNEARGHPTGRNELDRGRSSQTKTAPPRAPSTERVIVESTHVYPRARTTLTSGLTGPSSRVQGDPGPERDAEQVPGAHEEKRMRIHRCRREKDDVTGWKHRPENHRAMPEFTSCSAGTNDHDQGKLTP